MEYSVVIRTLGKSGDKYQQTLDSVKSQFLPPKDIYVYIAEGYPIPEETIGEEKYIYVRKGMVAQRALPYDEIDTEYILFLDDDVYLPSDAVEIMYRHLIEKQADVISPDVFPNAERSFAICLKMTFLGKSVARKNDIVWAYKVLRNGGYSYNANPKDAVYESQLNAGPCFFCKKDVFLSIHYEEESWLDFTPYALPDDQVMFYKLYKKGYKILTLFHSGIRHLDAGTASKAMDQKTLKVLYSESCNKLIYWHRFIYMPEKGFLLKMWDVCCIAYPYLLRSLIMCCKLDKNSLIYWWKGIRDAIGYIKSDDYRKLPLI